MIAVAIFAVSTLWRRRAPLIFLLVVTGVGDALSGGLQSVSYPTLTGYFVLFVPTYAVAAWADRSRAFAGLCLWVCGVTIAAALEQATFADFAAGTVTGIAIWVAGRVIRSWRELARQLNSTLARLATENDDRWRLAVASERASLVRDLHGVVAQRVTAMVVQDQVAQRLLEHHDQTADAAMRVVEEIGRDTLTEMRRVLGVLRRPGEQRELAPQPGVGQIHRLIQRAREHGQFVDLSVDGEPGVLSAVVDVGVYRILEEVLASTGGRGRAMAITLVFAEKNIEVLVTVDSLRSKTWPTAVMRDRVAACGGEFVTANKNGACQIAARMPRDLERRLT